MSDTKVLWTPYTVGPTSSFFVIPSGWTPASEGANLTAWYDASATNGVLHSGVQATDGQTADTWVDQSGNANNLTVPAGSNAPIFKTASEYNSKNGIDFTATGAQCLGSASQVIPSANTIVCGFFVGRMRTGTQTNGRALSFVTAALPTNDWDKLTGAALISRVTTTNAIDTTINSGVFENQSISLATNYRMGVIYASGAVKTYVNAIGSAGSAVAANFGAAGALRVGAAFEAGVTDGYWDGVICEVILTKSDLTSKVSQIETYFTNKWGS